MAILKTCRFCSYSVRDLRDLIVQVVKPRAIFALFLGTLLVAPAAGQVPSVDEYQIKAAFLLNFARFVEWPAKKFSPADKTLDVCILGVDPFGLALQGMIKGRAIDGRPLRLYHLKLGADTSECEIVFISAQEAKRKTRDLPKTAWGILTVGESQNFPQNGDVVNFFTREDRIAFEINVDAADHAGLRISSKLLNLATIVRSTEAGRN
jgi:hypothetical protein